MTLGHWLPGPNEFGGPNELGPLDLLRLVPLGPWTKIRL